MPPVRPGLLRPEARRSADRRRRRRSDSDSPSDGPAAPRRRHCRLPSSPERPSNQTAPGSTGTCGGRVPPSAPSSPGNPRGPRGQRCRIRGVAPPNCSTADSQPGGSSTAARHAGKNYIYI